MRRYRAASPKDSAGVLRARRMGSVRHKPRIVMKTAAMMMVVVTVPMVFFRSCRRPAPMIWDMMICPALVKPMHRAVVSHMSWEAMLTALSPLLPTNWPTTIMSTML